MDLLIAALGLVILLLAGDGLVKGAVNLSLRLGIPALIVSLTIVAFGTSAPELLIAVQAIGEGAPGLALGNVVGSNTANVLLVLGIPALITTMHSSVCDSRKSYLQMMAATALFIGVAWFGPITWVHGIVLLAALSWMLMSAIGVARCHRRDVAACKDVTEVKDVEGADPAMSGWKIAMYLLVGIVGLPLGADLLVGSATSIARAYNVSDAVIGLTLVAVGTSLPELATTVMAALRRQADVALGNVIGSNMFNLLAIIGLSSFVGDIPVDPWMLRYDIWVMAGASALLGLFVLGKRDISRAWGVLLVTLYIGYISMILFSSGTLHA